MTFAHIQDIVHRDIKPSNILIKDQQVYLADFGLAKLITNGSSQSSNFFVCGTPVHLASKVKNKISNGTKGDIFSLGCVFSEMLSVRCKKSLEDFQNFRRAQAEEQEMYAFRVSLPKVRLWVNQLREQSNNAVLDDLSNQILSMLSEDPERRKTAQQGVAALTTHRDSFFCRNHTENQVLPQDNGTEGHKLTLILCERETMSLVIHIGFVGRLSISVNSFGVASRRKLSSLDISALPRLVSSTYSISDK